MGTVSSDDRGLRFWYRGRVKLQVISGLCNKLLMITLNCWRVNESCTVDVTELFIQKLSAVFATKNLLELGGDECNNLNFLNFEIGSSKFVKKSWILGTFKIHKIRILNLWLAGYVTVHLMTSDKQPNASRTTESMSNRTVVTTAFKLWLRGEVARTLDNPIHNPQVAGSTPAASRSPARASVTKQCNLIPAQAGKATSGLASHAAHSLWISAWGVFLSAELRNRINDFFADL